MSKKIVFRRKDGIIEAMGIDEFSRWACLAEALMFIEEKTRELNIPVVKMIKPMVIDEYISERYPAMRHDVTCEVALGNI